MRARALLLVTLLAGCLSAPAPPPAPALPVAREALVLSTEAGTISILLYPEAAPQTVALLKAYVGEGYYVGRAFYRIVPGHVIQVTDAAGGATDDSRTVPLEAGAGPFHFSAGAAGIARGADPNSGGPEIFLMDFATSHLDGNYSVWGQVVEGLDVVHAIARGPAVDFTLLPPAAGPAEPTDRMAAQPVHILAARLEPRVLSAHAWAGLPLQVARNARVGDYRHSLEWPADMAAGHAGPFTWYVRAYNGAGLPLHGVVRILADGQAIEPAAEATAGVYPFQWAPPGPGPHALTFTVEGVPWATLQVVVPAPAPVK